MPYQISQTRLHDRLHIANVEVGTRVIVLRLESRTFGVIFLCDGAGGLSLEITTVQQLQRFFKRDERSYLALVTSVVEVLFACTVGFYRTCLFAKSVYIVPGVP